MSLANNAQPPEALRFQPLVEWSNLSGRLLEAFGLNEWGETVFLVQGADQASLRLDRDYLRENLGQSAFPIALESGEISLNPEQIICYRDELMAEEEDDEYVAREIKKANRVIGANDFFIIFTGFNWRKNDNIEKLQEYAHGWEQKGKKVQIVVLTVAPEESWEEDFKNATAFTPMFWGEVETRRENDLGKKRQQIETLLALLSPANGINPLLLRAMRTIVPEMSFATEDYVIDSRLSNRDNATGKYNSGGRYRIVPDVQELEKERIEAYQEGRAVSPWEIANKLSNKIDTIRNPFGPDSTAETMRLLELARGISGELRKKAAVLLLANTETYPKENGEASEDILRIDYMAPGVVDPSIVEDALTDLKEGIANCLQGREGFNKDYPKGLAARMPKEILDKLGIDSEGNPVST